ncbi:MAG: sigma-70 family RNA polymerase sigma factor [Acidobacteria bacterium]|nr:sigma-70 family RNA polymerase sigma factor [Acidobacteriota bacterium]
MGLPQIESGKITETLRAWSDGKQEALEMLLPLVYDELHRQAARFLRRERIGHTLQTTALINEVYLKLIDQKSVNWQNRAHFFGIAAQAMRRILVDYAKSRHREKRGGANENLPLELVSLAVSGARGIDLEALDEALTRLALMDNRQARIVELRYFSGLSIEETAEVLNISTATVKSDWRSAKAWLYREITK